MTAPTDNVNVLALVTCKLNGRAYVCVAGRVKHYNRSNPLAYGHGPVFIKAVQKHGASHFAIEILGRGYKTRRELYEAERRAIKRYETLAPNGYNISLGGIGPDYGPVFRASIAKRNARQEYRAAHSSGLRRAYSGPAARKRLSDAMKAAWKHPKTRLRHARAIRTLWKDPEYRNRVLRGLADPENKERHREAVRQAITAWWAKRKEA